VIFTGYVPNEEIISLYSGATIFIFPSFYEGFGIPPLEAMACGTPVVASNTSSIPEVVGDAALLFNPYNIRKITEAIYSALTDEQLRNKLIEKGFERVKQFSWENTARETLQVYKEVYRNKIKRN
jgi:glycosyltransferase involved in cell wall biosynthesis